MIKTGDRATKSTVKGTVWVVRGTYHLTKEATTLVYHAGRFTFEVVRAPLDAPLVRDELQTIDGLPVTEAIRLGRMKNRRSIIVRINDRGPFPSQHNPESGKKIIDVSRGAAEQLGFVEQDTARVYVETIQLQEG